MAAETLRAGRSAGRARPAGGRARARQRYPTLRRLLRHRLFVAGVDRSFLVVSLAAILADLITIADPLKLSIRNRFEPPSPAWPFGTDNFGRSQWSRARLRRAPVAADRAWRGRPQRGLRHAARRARRLLPRASTIP